MAAQEVFWRSKSLQDMTPKEWESLCDGCALCCLHKLEDEDTKEVFYTTVVCKLLDFDTCRCTKYEERCTLVPECVKLTPKDVDEFHWLPPTCAYRLVYEGKELPEWHPLISGDPKTVIEAEASVLSWYEVKDDEIDEEDFIDYIIE
ncbi:YcgN family cysteine cluster protein [Neptuniibacter sp.]|uniref:YcgN family cysteine cluster protein n=1 Tax=Neptuniibacter sp. TaxID=1962643 RepID=UPI0026085D01|nr:YcgN family cysteine cluster protein [Neptuniibacter sp.]